MTKTQEQLITDIQTQLNQFVYRGSLQPIDALVKFLQDVSTVGNMNWHIPENKAKMSSVFIKIAEVMNNYALSDGDFRSYMVLRTATIIATVYKDELFDTYLNRGYNVDPASVVGALSDNYSTQPPQNTNFPGKDNTSNEFIPIPPKLRLVPDTLYTNLD